ncbi:sigma-70 family RNA polymerase sigma factor [Microbacterium hydrocarbonoxydans]|uniref:sigma-70 family RNA polymerase sigma factor n=1 Tax=Microbacterium hydrocarbonoxydans TaxID=273678 RepID=UPI0020420917|nr:sigma-70 family RNA polymerase sigma factor [Microbacterium hydrocarbonoxydans]MCM3780488.1 sigma-70 family RNA polymerase sigma factor [Microbacterium hydrocarbonoxydans]
MPLRARNKLVVDHLHIVGAATAAVAARLTHVSREDLAAAGAFALVRAAEKYDESLGVPFGAYARERINWALKDELRAMDWAPRDVRARARETTRVRDMLGGVLGRTPTVAEIADAMGIDASAVKQRLADAERTVTSLDVLDVHEIVWTGYLPEEMAIAAEREELLHIAVDALPERKRRIVRAIYFEDRTVTEIAEELGVSHAAVSQQRSEAVRMLRDALDRHLADGYGEETRRSRSSTAVLDAYFDRLAIASGHRYARSFLGQTIGV